MPSNDHPLLRLRPLSGSEVDVQVLDPDLEPNGVQPATLPWPDPDAPGSSTAAQLLSDALLLSLRRGAGPFRCAAKLGFDPRAYQLVPLMMALRLDPVRLLIADDVGVGKTIEAGLIVRELVDRGEADRLTVLCPPHLVEQWTAELSAKFDFPCVAVTASSAVRLERDLPPGESLFENWPVTVVSLDYIKAAQRRDDFMRACPQLVVVDEAHGCVGTGQRRQQRFSLLRDLSADAQRHLILLTATPHSGVEDAFDRLVGLLDEQFADGRGLSTAREQLARHFVQRRRIDLGEVGWADRRTFPRHETTEAVYRLDDRHLAFHEAVLDYCLQIATAPGVTGNRRRLAFWGTLALMRCVGSSPAAAASTLRNRLAGVMEGELAPAEPVVFDEDEEDGDLSADDLEPAPALDQEELVGAEHRELRELIRQAEELDQARETDPKLRRLDGVLRPLIRDGFSPVVFCRFMATADAVGEYLRAQFPRARVEVVTGRLTPPERHARVDAMAGNGAAEQRRVLVATDCLSEGINLQYLFDAVVHYDLCWNPTRHQQREGRVDRFGQPRALVRSALLYGDNSAIDGAVLDVILRKAEAIRSATGVAVPLPDERDDLASALLHAVLLRRNRDEPKQLLLDLEADTAPDAARVDTFWRDAEEGEKRSRTRFAQRPLRPQEVKAVWDRTRRALGGADEVQRFVDRALKRFDAPLAAAGAGWRAPLAALPAALRERLAAHGVSGTLRLSFRDPAPGEVEVHRGHALVATLAEALLEGALAPEEGDGLLPARCGAWRSGAVAVMTTVVLLRLRHKLTPTQPGAPPLLAEEASALAWRALADAPAAAGAQALALLTGDAEAALPESVIVRQLHAARERLQQRRGWLQRHAEERAQALAADHAQVRAAARVSVGVRVEAALPVDVIGLYVLLPVVA